MQNTSCLRHVGMFSTPSAARTNYMTVSACAFVFIPKCTKVDNKRALSQIHFVETSQVHNTGDLVFRDRIPSQIPPTSLLLSLFSVQREVLFQACSHLVLSHSILLVISIVLASHGGLFLLHSFKPSSHAKELHNDKNS
jgi:hypothetical protein